MPTWGEDMGNTSKQGKRPRSRQEVLKYGRKLGGVVVEGGRHTKIYNPETGQHVAVPRHSGDLARGTLSAITSRLKAMFLVLVMLSIPVCLAVWLVAGLSGR